MLTIRQLVSEWAPWEAEFGEPTGVVTMSAVLSVWAWNPQWPDYSWPAILFAGNPLEDLVHIREPLGVMAAGRWYSRETLERMIAIEE
jgi:hypothetical protein